MQEVSVTFNNLQSHEHTTFVLKPGLNFILANDNNVGKSTIFKVFMAIAKAPNNPPAKVDALIRYDCDRGFASFDFCGQRVVAWFQRQKGYASRMFFEQTFEDGQVSRSMQAPADLLNALGIVIDRDGCLVNFNDADSVQLIASYSKEADSILTSVILDQRVEHMKDNLGRFNQMLANDLKMTRIKEEDSQEALGRLTYNPAVDEFFEQLDDMQRLCRVCDDIPQISALLQETESADLMDLNVLYKVTSDFSQVNFDMFSKTVSSLLDLEQIYSVLAKLGTLNIVLLANSQSSQEVLHDLSVMQSTLSKLGDVVRHAWKVTDSQIDITRVENKMRDISEVLHRVAPIVMCPVKGKVFYTDEECLPNND